MMSDGVPDVTWTKREPPSKPTAEAVITGNGGAIDLTDMGLYPEVSVTDRVWRLARPDVIGERSCRLFACWAARRVLEPGRLLWHLDAMCAGHLGDGVEELLRPWIASTDLPGSGGEERGDGFAGLSRVRGLDAGEGSHSTGEGSAR